MRVLGLEVRRASKPDLGLYGKYPPQSLRGRRFVNVGAGDWTHPYWTNLDHATEHYHNTQSHPFVEHDLTKPQPMPMGDESLEAVYVSHVLEHVNDEAAKRLFNEAHRVLKPGGVIRVVAPNVMLYYDAMRSKDRSFWYMLRSYYRDGYLTCMPDEATLPQLFLFEFATMLSTLAKKRCEKVDDATIGGMFSGGVTEDAFNYFTARCTYHPKYSGYHINWWSPGKAVEMLTDYGLHPYESAYLQSRCPPMRDTMFDATHPRISFYVEAVK